MKSLKDYPAPLYNRPNWLDIHHDHFYDCTYNCNYEELEIGYYVNFVFQVYEIYNIPPLYGGTKQDPHITYRCIRRNFVTKLSVNDYDERKRNNTLIDYMKSYLHMIIENRIMPSQYSGSDYDSFPMKRESKPHKYTVEAAEEYQYLLANANTHLFNKTDFRATPGKTYLNKGLYPEISESPEEFFNRP